MFASSNFFWENLEKMANLFDDLIRSLNLPTSVVSISCNPPVFDSVDTTVRRPDILGNISTGLTHVNIVSDKSPIR